MDKFNIHIEKVKLQPKEYELKHIVTVDDQHPYGWRDILKKKGKVKAQPEKPPGGG